MAACNVVIDLSHNNETVDLVRAQANGVLGVIHKATQGSGFADPAYAARRQAAKHAGLLWGAYHFGTSADPVAQARFFLKTASPAPQELVVLDFETNPANASNSMSLDQARTFIATVQDAA
jgi:lysozyme